MVIAITVLNSQTKISEMFRMRRCVTFLLGAFFISACAGGGDQLNSSSSSFRYDGQTFTVSDRPEASKIQIGPSAASAVLEGLFDGRTYGLFDDPTSEISRYRAAAQAYLNSTGRICGITSGGLINNPVFEFSYHC